jgi:hypothetical protein
MRRQISSELGRQGVRFVASDRARTMTAATANISCGR